MATNRALIFEEEDFKYTSPQGESSELPEELQHELMEFAGATDLQVTNDEEYVVVAEYVRDEVSPRIKAVKEFFAPLKKATSMAHRAVCSQENNVLETIMGIKTLLVGRLEHHDNEKARVAAEAAAVARKEAEEAARAQREKEVEELIEKGDEAKAEKVLAEPIIPKVAAPPPAKEAPKVSGVVKTKRWKARIDDKVALIRWLGEGTDEEVEDKLHFVEFLQAEFNRAATASRRSLKIPGVSPYEETGISTRGGKK